MGNWFWCWGWYWLSNRGCKSCWLWCSYRCYIFRNNLLRNRG